MWLFYVLSGFFVSSLALLPAYCYCSSFSCPWMDGWIYVLHFFVVILFAVSYCVILQMGFDYLGPLAFPSRPT